MNSKNLELCVADVISIFSGIVVGNAVTKATKKKGVGIAAGIGTMCVADAVLRGSVERHYQDDGIEAVIEEVSGPIDVHVTIEDSDVDSGKAAVVPGKRNDEDYDIVKAMSDYTKQLNHAFEMARKGDESELDALEEEMGYTFDRSAIRKLREQDERMAAFQDEMARAHEETQRKIESLRRLRRSLGEDV